MYREVNGEAADHITAGNFGTGLVEVLMTLARPAANHQQPASAGAGTSVLQAALQVCLNARLVHFSSSLPSISAPVGKHCNL